MQASEITLAAAFAGGVLTSASPCVLAAVPVAVGFVGGNATSAWRNGQLTLALVAGMVLAFTGLGLAAAQLGIFMGTLPGLWTALTGLVIAAVGAWIAARSSALSLQLPRSLQQRLARSGWVGALLLGALLGTAMTPCASPALGAALAVAGSSASLDGSMWSGVMLLAAYGLGHSVLVFVAGLSPAAAQATLGRLRVLEPWLPGRRVFGLLMVAAGAWLLVQALLG